MKYIPNIRKKSLKEHFTALLLLAPVLVPLLVFWIYPMCKTLFLSFTDWDYISPEYNMVGFSNYSDILQSDFFYQTLKNTLVFALGTVIPPIVIGFLIANLIRAVDKGRSLFLTGIFSSWITPILVVSMVWSGMFAKDNGLINQVIQFFGGAPVDWLWQSGTAMVAVITVTVWQYTGIAVLLLSAAMAKTDPAVEEAARLDGARGLRKMLKITFPSISPTVFFLLILFLLDSLKAYDQIYILTQGGPAGATSTLLYYFYIAAFEWFQTGTASTVAMVIVVLSVTISAVNFLYSRKWVHY